MKHLKQILTAILFVISLFTCLSGSSREKNIEEQPKQLDQCGICGAEVLTMVTDKGKHIRLNLPPEKRFTIEAIENEEAPSLLVAKMRDAYTAHIWTCPGVPPKGKK